VACRSARTICAIKPCCAIKRLRSRVPLNPTVQQREGVTFVGKILQAMQEASLAPWRFCGAFFFGDGAARGASLFRPDIRSECSHLVVGSEDSQRSEAPLAMRMQ
jgi:hypothetical protein